MTISTNKSYINNEVVDALQTEYPYDFLIQESEQAVVLFDADVVPPSEYSLTGLGFPQGGTVVLSSPPPAGTEFVTIIRVLPLTQGIDYSDYDDFPAETHEGGLDKLTMITQQLQEQLDRAIVVPPGNPGVEIALPPYDPGKGWMWDETEQKVINSDDNLNGIVAAATEQAGIAEQQANRATTQADLAEFHANAASDSRDEAGASATKAENEANRAQQIVDDAEADIIAEGNAQVARVTSEGDTQEARVIAAGDVAVDARDFAQKWASEEEDVEINDGVNPVGYSAFHWSEKARLAAIGLAYKGPWDPNDGAYPSGPHLPGDLYVVIAAGSYDGTDWLIGDWLIRNTDNNGWHRYPNVVEYSAITDVPENVANAVSRSGDTMTGPLDGVAPTDDPHLTRKDYVDSENAEQDVIIAGKVDKAGDTMTGPLVLPGAPTADLQAATKKYTDDAIAALPPGTPVGTIIMFPSATPPDGYLLCNGASTAGYPQLAAIVGANTPDLRGQFIRGWSTDASVDPAGPRAPLATQQDAQQPITATWSVQNGIPSGGTGCVSRSGSLNTKDGNTGNAATRAIWDLDSSRQVRAASENRPKNIAMVFCIKHD